MADDIQNTTDNESLPAMPSFDDLVKESRARQMAGTGVETGTSEQEPTQTPESAPVTALKSAATGVVPAVGAATGAEIGAGIGAFGGPLDIVTVPLGGFVGAIAGSIAASKAQKAALDKVAPGLEEQAAVNEKAHPIASAIGDIASSLPAFEFAPGKTVEGVGNLVKMARGVPLGKTPEEIAAAKSSVLALAAQSGMGVAGSVIAPLIQGESPDLKDIGISTLTALLFGKPRDYLENTFHTLGLPKPPVDKDNEAEKPTAVDGKEPPPPSENILENPGKAYDVPDSIKEKLSDIAQRESNVGFENLPPEDHQALNDAIQPYGKDYHKDAATLYAVEKSKADAQRSAEFATTAAMPHATDIVNHDNIPAGDPVELKPALIVDGKPVVGGGTHAEVFQNAVKNPEVDIDAAAKALGDDSAHQFVKVELGA